MKKPRSDSKLLNLPDEQAATLSDWIMGGLPYARIKALVKKEFEIETSEAALSRFYSEFCGAALLARRARAVSTAEQVATEAQKHPGKFDNATIDAIKQKVFELSISPQSDPDDVSSLFHLILKARDQDLDERKLQLAQEKYHNLVQQSKREIEKALQGEHKRGGVSAETLEKIEQSLKLL